MNKKGIITIIVIIVLVIIGYMIWGGQGSSTAPAPVGETTTSTPADTTTQAQKDSVAPVTAAGTDASLLARLRSSSVAASESGNRVALANGKASFTDGTVKGTLALGDIAIAKTFSGSNYALATLSVNSGGSGTFQYVVLFQDKNGTLTDNSYAVIGDRVKITGVQAQEITGTGGAKELVVLVSYLDRPQTDAMTVAPSIPRTKILVVENGEFNAAKEVSL